MRDISHPECEAQLDDVMTVLEKQLSIKAPLIDNMIEAHNKIDIWYVTGMGGWRGGGGGGGITLNS